MLLSARAALGLCALLGFGSVHATQSSSVIDAFSQFSINGPIVEYDGWPENYPIDSVEFISHYADQFNIYAGLATSMSLQAIACDQGSLTKHVSYQPTIDVQKVYNASRVNLTRAQNQINLWRNFGDLGARQDLQDLMPHLTAIYSRILFELSGCSGYLYGELVN